MKFGGTSVQDAQAIDRAAAIVRHTLRALQQPLRAWFARPRPAKRRLWLEVLEDLSLSEPHARPELAGFS